MAIKYAVVSGGATSGLGETTGTAWTLAYALGQNGVVAGDTLRILTGTYPTNQPLTPYNNGTSTAPIILEVPAGETVTLQYRADLQNKQYITVRGFRFYSLGYAVLLNDSSGYITVENCEFDMPVGAYGAQAQLLMKGSWHKIYDCVFTRWTGQDGVQAFGHHYHIKGNDFGGYQAGHGSLNFYGGYSVIEENYFRNPVAGVREFVGRVSSGGGSYDARENVVQNNIMYRSNYSGVGTIEGWGGEQSEKGDAQAHKLGGTGLIFRNNLVGETQEPPAVSAYQYQGVFQFDNYTQRTTEPVQYLEHIRDGCVYHNTLFSNEMNGFSHTKNSNNLLQGGGWKFLNNIITDQAMADFYFNNTAGIVAILDTFEWHGNMCDGTVRDRNLQSTAFSTFDAWRTAWVAAGTGRASKVTNNSTATPVFVNGDTSAAQASLSTKIVRDNFLLDPASPGVGDAQPLTTVTANSTGNVVQVANAKFFTDGMGIKQGDQIRINGQVARITATNKWSEPQTITLDTNINATIGDSVWLTMFGETPNRGIAALGVSAPEDAYSPETPVIYGTKILTASASAMDTTNFTPPARALMIAVFVGTNTNNPSPIATVNPPTTTIGTVSPFTLISSVERDAGTDSHLVAYWAQVGDAPTSGKIDWTFSSPMTSRLAFAVIIPHEYLASTPIGESKTISTINGAPSMTFTAQPEEHDLVLAIANSRTRASAITFPAGWNDLYNAAFSSHWANVIWKRENHSTTVNWTAMGTAGNVCMAFVIRSGPGNGTYSPPVIPVYTTKPRKPTRSATSLSVSKTRF